MTGLRRAARWSGSEAAEARRRRRKKKARQEHKERERREERQRKKRAASGGPRRRRSLAWRGAAALERRRERERESGRKTTKTKNRVKEKKSFFFFSLQEIKSRPFSFRDAPLSPLLLLDHRRSKERKKERKERIDPLLQQGTPREGKSVERVPQKNLCKAADVFFFKQRFSSALL